MKKILLTGATGFIGMELVPRLVKEGYEVHALERYVTGRYSFDGKQSVINHYGTLTDYPAIKNIVREVKPDYTIHLAAISPVSFSYDHYIEVTETNYLGTVNLAEACYREVPHFGQFIMAGTCYDSSTRAYTRDGLRDFDKLNVGDEVLSINPDTKEIEWKPITKKISTEWNGKLLHFKGKGTDLLVTPNHRMLIETHKNNGTWQLKFEPAIETASRSVFKLVKGTWKGMGSERIVINSREYSTSDLFYLIGLYIGDGSSDMAKRTLTVKTGLNRAEYMSIAHDAAGRFKTVEGTSTVKTFEYQRTFLYIPRSDKSRNRVEELLTRMGLGWHAEGEIVMYFSDIRLKDILDECGHTAKEKRVPEWMLEYGAVYLEALLGGLLDSDGNRGRFITTVSTKLAEQIIELCAKLGMTATINQRHRSGAIEGRIVEGDCYDISISRMDRRLGSTYSPVRYEDYNGVVWCVEVKDNKNLLVERKGKVAFCGNSEEYGMTLKQKDKKLNEDSELSPNSPYAVAKVASDLYLRYMHGAYGFPFTTLRPYNTYGRKYNAHFFVERTITQMLKGGKVYLGDKSTVRDWIYVDDHVEAYMKALGNGKAIGEVIQVCSGKGYTTEQTADIIAKLTGFRGEVVWNSTPRRPLDARILIGDNSKARKLLGWEPKYTLEEGLRKTIEYWRKTGE